MITAFSPSKALDYAVRLVQGDGWSRAIFIDDAHCTEYLVASTRAEPPKGSHLYATVYKDVQNGAICIRFAYFGCTFYRDR